MTTTEFTDRWLGILASGLLVGREDEIAARKAQKVLGVEPLTSLRVWFGQLTPDEAADAQTAAIEACIAMVHADRKVDDEERELMGRIIEHSGLEEVRKERLNAHVESPQPIEGIAARLGHPALRELLLVLAWEIATVDGRATEQEEIAFNLLADKLGVPAARSAELRAALTNQ